MNHAHSHSAPHHDGSCQPEWQIRDDTIYLNHGSFGPPTRQVQAAERRYKQQMDEQPMDFFVRRYEALVRRAVDSLAELTGTVADNLALMENATAAMNVVAHNLPLAGGDNIVLNDHEYGAVNRIWTRRCAEVDCEPPRRPAIALPVADPSQIVEAVMSACDQRTRLIVVSHITSPTALVMPVGEICQAARQCQIPVCIDGPHAVAQRQLSLDQLQCDFYTASCHKWLSAPFGSGFLFASPRWHDRMQPPQLSWGRLLPNPIQCWSDEFIWSGTRNASGLFAIADAIQVLSDFGWERFREQTHRLAQYARERLLELPGTQALTPDALDWYGSMAIVELPAGDAAALQQKLWLEHHIEVPVISWNERRFIRVSCHLYNTEQQIDSLIAALTGNAHISV